MSVPKHWPGAPCPQMPSPDFTLGSGRGLVPPEGGCGCGGLCQKSSADSGPCSHWPCPPILKLWWGAGFLRPQAMVWGNGSKRPTTPAPARKRPSPRLVRRKWRRVPGGALQPSAPGPRSVPVAGTGRVSAERREHRGLGWGPHADACGQVPRTALCLEWLTAPKSLCHRAPCLSQPLRHPVPVSSPTPSPAHSLCHLQRPCQPCQARPLPPSS